MTPNGYGRTHFGARHNAWYNRHYATRKAVILFITGIMLPTLTTCTYVVRIPSAITRGGGFYQPWTVLHTEHRTDVLACIGFPADALFIQPTLWVSARPLTDERGHPLMAFYDIQSHAIVFAPYVLVSEYWSVFRHEMIHATERAGGHGERFVKSDECNFWPAS